ncbi:hypothetical protein [Novosphingobium rosa]|uniref:hypothetical protein n=1 Tax=Novosphingobium rosa TaxID=76978 RepID=UPI00082A6373|nr:hypothetical protein [Novosphingobium rosa]
MLPDIDLRIACIVKALEQAILPALPTRERLARDQIRLCIGHLQMIGQQWRWAEAFEAASLAAMIALGRQLLPCVDHAFHDALSAGLEQAGTGDANAAIRALGGIIDRIILGENGTIALSAPAREAILTYGEEQARRERIWFAGNALDPDRHDLPSFTTLIDTLSHPPENKREA